VQWCRCVDLPSLLSLSFWGCELYHNNPKVVAVGSVIVVHADGKISGGVARIVPESAVPVVKSFPT
jgi:hypothetical protein